MDELLAPHKGIEVVLRALPKVIKKYPNAVYIVVGATHPSLLRHEGEAYRIFLDSGDTLHNLDLSMVSPEFLPLNLPIVVS